MAKKKKAEKKKKPYQLHKLFDNGKAKNKNCPKCGPGVFMGVHKDRVSCGACHYSEFTSK